MLSSASASSIPISAAICGTQSTQDTAAGILQSVPSLGVPSRPRRSEVRTETPTLIRALCGNQPGLGHKSLLFPTADSRFVCLDPCVTESVRPFLFLIMLEPPDASLRA